MWLVKGAPNLMLRLSGLPSAPEVAVITENSVHARPASSRGCAFPSAGYRGDDRGWRIVAGTRFYR
jgi:hypothetical protein